MTASFTRISAHDAQNLIEKGTSQIIDIRDAMSFQAGHMTAAIRIGSQFPPARAARRPAVSSKNGMNNDDVLVLSDITQ